MLAQIGRLVRDPNVQIDVFGFVVALIVSALVSIVVALLYQVFFEDRATGSRINRSFLLLGPSITALFIAVQFSLPLSLGLLGALSIVRFRTPIKEPEEIGFIMLLVGTAVVCATLQFKLLFALIAVAVFMLLMQYYLPSILGSKRRDGVLLVTMPGGTTPRQCESLVKLLGQKLSKGQLQSISYSDAQLTVYYSFNSLSQEVLNDLHTSIAEVAPIENLNIHFNRQGMLP